MNKRLFIYGLLLVLLCCGLSGGAQAKEWLSEAEKAEMRSLAGEEPEASEVSLMLSPGATAYDVIYSTGYYLDDLTVDDELAACLRMLEYSGHESAGDLKLQVTKVKNELYQDYIQPMKFYHEQLNNAVARLETLLELLDDPEAELSDITKASYASECRFLRQMISGYIGEAADVHNAAEEAVSRAEKELDRLRPSIHAAVQGFAGSRVSGAKQLQQEENEALAGSIRVTSPSFKDTKKSGKIVVIDKSMFGITVTRGTDGQDFISGAEVTVYNDEKKTHETAVTDETGVVYFPVKNYSFDDGEAQVHAVIKAKGCREVCYLGARVSAGASYIVPMAEDDGTPYVREASVNGDDILNESGASFYHIPNSHVKYTLSIQLANLPKNKKVSLTIYVDDPNVDPDKRDVPAKVDLGEFTTDDTGWLQASKTDEFARLLRVKEKGDDAAATLRVEVYQDKKKLAEIPMAGKVIKAIFEDPIDLSSSVPGMTPGTIGVKLGHLDPVFKNPSMEVGSPLLPPVSFKADADGKFVLGIGMQKGNRKEVKLIDGSTVQAKDLYMKDIKKDYSNQIIYMNYYAKKTGNDQSKVVKIPSFGKFKWDWKFSVGVCAQVKWQSDENTKIIGDFWSGVSVSGTISYTQQFFAPPPVSIPFYIGFDFSLGLSAGFEAGVAAQEKDGTIGQYDVQPVTKITVSPSLSIGVSAGVGVAGVVTVGVRGYFNFSPVIVFQPVLAPGASANIYWQLTWGAGLDVEVKALLFNVKIKLLSYSDVYPKKPEPFIPEQVTVSAGSGTAASSVSGSPAQLTSLPGEGQVLSLAPKESIVRAFGEGEEEGIKPERETVYDGNFDVTKLKSVTMDDGRGGYVNLVFSAGSQNQTNLGYSCIMYSTSDGDRLDIRGAAYSTDDEADFISDFDVAYSSDRNTVYLLVIYGHAEQNGDEWSIYSTEAYVCAFTLDADGKKLNRIWKQSFQPKTEDGNGERVFLSKPALAAGSKTSTAGASFAMIGTDLSDVDEKGSNYGHKPGTYFYVGSATENENPFWRYNYLRLDDNEEVLQLIFLPRPVVINTGKWSLYTYTIAALTGVKGSGSNGEDADFDHNRIRYQDMSVAALKEQVYSYTYLPNQHVLHNEKTFGSVTVDDVHVSNIMPGFGEDDVFAVAAAEGGAVTDDGGRESTLNLYTFPFTERTYSAANFGFTTSMNWFGQAEIAGGKYLYWLQDYDSDPQKTNGSPKRHVIRACLYDPDNHCFTEPFDLVELSYSPRTVALGSGTVNDKGNAMGLYTIESQDSAANSDTAVWNYVDMDYTLKTCLDMVAFGSQSNCATAGEDAELLVTVENTGNTLIASFDVSVTEDGSGEKLGTVHVDAMRPAECSVELYELDGSDDDGPVWSGGPESVYCLNSGGYGACSRIVVTELTGSGASTELFSLGLVPRKQAVYKISVPIPESWKQSERTITAEVQNILTPVWGQSVFVSQNDTEDVDPGVFSTREIAAAMEAASVMPEEKLSAAGAGQHTNATEGKAEAAAQKPNANAYGAVRNYSSRSSTAMKIDHEDMGLDLRLVRFPDGEYVEARITNASFAGKTGGYGAAPLPTLTFTAVDAEGREKTVFSHTFANSIYSDYGYTLLIPLDLVDGDGVYNRLVGKIDGGNEEELEFNHFNNREEISGNQHSITVLTEGPGKAYAQNESGKKVTTAVTGEKFMLTALPDEGASLVEWRLGSLEPEEDGTFRMPAYDVVVTAVFGQPLLIVKDPEDAWINSGEKASFRVTAKGEDLTYQWYENRTHPASRNTSEGWKLLEGATEAQYTTGAMPRKADGYLYRCVVTDRYGRQVTSGAAMLHIKVPRTGDSTDIALWAGFMALGIAGVLTAVIRRRTRGRTRP